MIKLYYVKGACSMVPHVALEMIGEPYEALHVAKDIARESYRRMNPSGGVPMIQDGEFLLTQNLAILRYIDGKSGGEKLYGKTTLQQRAVLDQWLLFFNADVHPSFGPIFNPNGYAVSDEGKKEVRAKAVEKLQTLFGRANAFLEGRDYFGDVFTIVDVYAYVVTRWTRSIEDLDLSKYTHLWEHFECVDNNRYVQKVLTAEGF